MPKAYMAGRASTTSICERRRRSFEFRPFEIDTFRPQLGGASLAEKEGESTSNQLCNFYSGSFTFNC